MPLGEKSENKMDSDSFIHSFGICSFLFVFLNPAAAEGPAAIFQRDFLLAYREVDVEQADVALKYFCEHALQWMTPTNVGLNAFSESKQ